jgi:hypothetical protein
MQSIKCVVVGDGYVFPPRASIPRGPEMVMKGGGDFRDQTLTVEQRHH